MRVSTGPSLLLYKPLSVRLHSRFSAFACVCIFLTGPMTLFMDQSNDKKTCKQYF